MKRLIVILVFLVLLVSGNIVLAADTSDALYSGVVRITNNSTAATGVSVPFTANSTVYINGGYANSSFNNSAITSPAGGDVAYMPGYAGDPWVVYVPSIGATTILNNTLYMGGGTDMQGDIVWFPGTGGGTVADNANLEPGDNFSISITGMPNISAAVDKNILRKTGAYDFLINPTDTDNVSFTMFDSSNTTTLVHNSDSAEAAYVTQAIAPRMINLISFRVLNPVASGPEARLHVIQAYNSSNGSWVNPSSSNSSWTNNANALNGSTVSYAHDVANNAWTKWFTAYFNPPVESHQVRWYFTNPGGDYTTKQVYVGGLPGITVSTTVTATDQILTAAAVSGANLTLSVDGAAVDTVALGGYSVPDNSNGLTFCNNAAMLYVDSANISLDGAAVASWSWEYTATFTDGISSIVMTPTFRTTSSDADVSAVLVDFLPITQAQAPAYSINITTTAWITGGITQSGNFSSNTTLGAYPGSGIISETATAGGVPRFMIEIILAGIGILALSMFISWLMKNSREGSILFKVLVITAALGIMVAVRVIDNWLLYIFLIISTAVALIASGRTFEGTGNASNNLIGFLGMAFIGMTTINRILEGRFIQASDVTILRNTLAFQPFEVFGLFTIPVPNTNFLLNGIPSLIRWDYSFFGGQAQILQYMLYSVTAVASFMLFVLVFGAIYQMFSRGR